MIRYRFDEDIKKSVKDLCVYNNYSGVVAVGMNVFFVGVAIAISEYNVWFLPLSILLIGSRQRALATILHEAAHGTLCRNKGLNKLLGTWFSGYLVFQSWSAYRASHVQAHHTRLGQADEDPDYRFYVESGVYDTKSRNVFIYRHIVGPLILLNFLSSVFYLVRHRLLGANSRRELPYVLAAVSAMALLGSLIVGPKFFLLYWLLPYLTVFQIITWFIELSEHFPMVRYAKKDIEATRNRFSHALEHFLTGMHGENFHLVHHLFPGVPFYRLRAAHRILLKDPMYARLNANAGGIFLSSNFAPAIIPTILSDLSSRDGKAAHA
jgi:fatty acid desaturase